MKHDQATIQHAADVLMQVQGDIIYVHAHTSKSGLTHRFRVFANIAYSGQLRITDIGYHVGVLTGCAINGRNEVAIRGMGMDMAFAMHNALEHAAGVQFGFRGV